MAADEEETPDMVLMGPGGKWCQMRIERGVYDALQRAKAKLFLLKTKDPDQLPEWFAGRVVNNSTVVEFLIHCHKQLVANQRNRSERGKR